MPVEVGHHEAVKAPSVRLLATNAKDKYFGATSEDKSVGCVIAHDANDACGWVSGCGTLGTAGETVQASRVHRTHEVLLIRDDDHSRTGEANGCFRPSDNILASD